MSRKATLEPPRPVLTLSPFNWRAELEHQLIDVGIGHDLAGIVARRTLQGLVERLTKPGYTSHRIDELYP